MERPGSDASTPLRTALRANALFSAVSGLALVAGAGLLGPWMGVQPAILAVVGVGLLPFAFLLVRQSRRETLDEGEARLVVAADVAWVLGSALLLVADPIGLTLAGKLAVAGVALCVADFAIWQAVGLGRLRRAAAPA